MVRRLIESVLRRQSGRDGLVLDGLAGGVDTGVLTLSALLI